MSEPEKAKESTLALAKRWGGTSITVSYLHKLPIPSRSDFYNSCINSYILRKPSTACTPSTLTDPPTNPPPKTSTSRHANLRTTCSTLPTIPDDLPTSFALQHVPQSPRLQDRQRWDDGSVQWNLPLACESEAAGFHEQIRRKRAHSRRNDGVVSGECGWRWTGLCFRFESEGG